MSRTRVSNHRFTPRATLVAALATASFAAVLSQADSALAQTSGAQDDRAREALRSAQEAYQNLDLDGASARVREARRRCGRNGCSPRVVAEIAVMDGVIAVGGRNDQDAGLRAFSEAVRSDPRVAIDPTIATPEINAVFSRARRQARGEVAQLLHEPVQEQLARAPIPVSIETGQIAPSRVELSYRTGEDAPWRRLRMERMGRAWGVEIPCDVTRSATAVDYYVTAYDPSDLPMGEAGNEDTPLRVSIVRQRTRPAPALPGRLPPEVCRDASDRASVGGACAQDAECATGLVCRESVCAQPPPPRPSVPLFEVEFGGGFGLVSVSGTPAYDEAVRIDPMNPMSPAACMMVSCPSMTGGLSVTGYLIPSLRVHFAQRFGVGLSFRIQPDAGPRTALANLLIALRGYYAVTSNGFARTGLVAAVFAGTGVGQISARAPGYEGQPFPTTGHVITGLNSIQAGGRIEYGVGPGFRFGGDLALQFLFPRFVFSADITAFVGIAFL
ncbi:MAG: hypothetical protein JNK05_25825 [Myxococcales bacterium]|nr:hypothetical protein [Myxococcales bacterium]